MEWNNQLHHYCLSRGGTYFGAREGNWHSELLLEDGKEPMLIRGEYYPLGRSCGELVRVCTRLSLERPYELTISSQSLMNRGLNLVAGRENYGVPQLSRKRRIRSNEPSFTTQVLRDGTLRRRLELSPRCALSVRPISGGPDSLHLLEVHQDMVDLLGDPLVDAALAQRSSFSGLMPDAETSPSQDDQEAFQARLDQIVSLARAARQAVMFWRM